MKRIFLRPTVRRHFGALRAPRAPLRSATFCFVTIFAEPKIAPTRFAGRKTSPTHGPLEDIARIKILRPKRNIFRKNYLISNCWSYFLLDQIALWLAQLFRKFIIHIIWFFAISYSKINRSSVRARFLISSNSCLQNALLKCMLRQEQNQVDCRKLLQLREPVRFGLIYYVIRIFLVRMIIWES